MAFPALAAAALPAAIGAASSILGGARNRSAAYDQWKRDADLQREFAQHSLQWRMQDAKAAGIHPVIAAGSSYSASAPVSSHVPDSGLAAAGQHVANALIQKKNMDLIDAQIEKTKAEARAIDTSLVARTAQPVPNTGDIPTTYPLDPQEQVIMKQLGNPETKMGGDRSVFFSTEDMSRARHLYGDEPVEWFMGLPNLLRDGMYQLFKKYGKGMSFTEWAAKQAHDNSAIYRALTRKNEGRCTRGQRKRGLCK
jgi:hypothetical protein